jgi:hypothetical protein
MSARSSAAARVALGLALAATVFAFLFLTRSLEQYGDGLSYVESARSGIDLFHPHHLGYISAVRAVYQILRAAGAKVDPITAAQLHNILWALAALFSAAFLARRLTGSWAWALFAAFALLVCQGFWEYATQAQVYVPAMGAAALTACLASGRPGRPWTLPRIAALSALFVLAVLYHQTMVLFLLPLAVLFALSTDNASRLRLAGGALAAAFLILALYAAAFLSRGEPFTVSGFLGYALRYTYHPAPQWGAWSNLGPAGVGYALFSLLRNVIPVVGAFQKPAVAAFGVFLLVLFIWHIRRLGPKGEPGARPLRAFLLTWLAVHGGFYLWWAPQDKNNFTVALFPLVLLVLLAGRDATAGMSATGRRLVAAAGALLLIGLGLINYTRFIRPLHLSPGPNYAEAVRLAACVRDGDYILSGQDVLAHLTYYFRRPDLLQIEILPMSFGRGRDLPKAYQVLTGRPAVLSPAYLDPGSKLSMLSGYERPRGWRRWMTWLFGLETDARGDVVSGRAFELLPCGDAYLRIRTDRIALDGWPGFLTRLDELLAPALGGRSRVFRDWSEATDSARRP